MNWDMDLKLNHMGLEISLTSKNAYTTYDITKNVYYNLKYLNLQYCNVN
jgi:hypothetical protein